MKKSLILLPAVLMAASLTQAQMASHAPTQVARKVAAAPASDDRPVARVNGAVLTERDLMREVFTIFPYAAQHNGIPKSMAPEMRKGALAMIEFEELVYQEAQRRKIVIDRAQIDKAEAQIRRRFSTQAEFDRFVATQFGTRQALRQKVERSLLIEYLLQREVRGKAAVTEVQARQYYEANPKSFDRPETFSIQTISIIPPQNASAEVRREAERRAQNAYRDAKATKTSQEFGLLAEKVSDDDWHVNMGDRKGVAREALPPEVVKAALGMKPGDVSELIKLGENYTLFRLNGHTPQGRTPFREVKTKLQEELAKTKLEQLRASFDKRLRQNAKVEEL